MTQCSLFLAGFLLQTGLFHMVMLLDLLICRTKQCLGPVNRLSVYDTLQGQTPALAFCLGCVRRGVLRLSYSLFECVIQGSAVSLQWLQSSIPLSATLWQLLTWAALQLPDIQPVTILGKGHMAYK